MPANATGARAIANALMGGGGARVVAALSSGDNTITPPPTADFVIIELDEQDTTVVTLSAGATDEIVLSRLGPTVLCCTFLTTTTFVLQSVSAGCNVWLTYGRLH